MDRVFSPSMNWLRGERPEASTLADSIEVLMPGIIKSCLNFVGKPLAVRCGLLSKERVEKIISDVCLELVEIKKENEVLHDREIVGRAASLGPAPEASSRIRGTWITRCPGTNHTLELQPERSLFYCGYCRVGGGVDKLEEFTAARAPQSGEREPSSSHLVHVTAGGAK